MTPAEIIRKVRRLEIRTRHLVTDSVSGAYHSSFKGRGMDFEEVREYAAGDDVRAIDWNVSARMDKPYVKIFREERELTLLLVVDLSASGIFGSVEQSKRERAAEIASVLAFSATRNNDKVGLLLYSDDVEKYIPPKKGRQHILRVIRDILFHQPAGRGTNPVQALEYLSRVQRRKAVVFLLSDFLDADDACFQSLALVGKRHDLINVILSDPRESRLPDVGLITLEDAESNQVVEIDTGNPRVRQRYRAAAAERAENLAARLRQKGLDWVETSTDAPYMPALQQLFARRAKRF